MAKEPCQPASAGSACTRPKLRVDSEAGRSCARLLPETQQLERERMSVSGRGREAEEGMGEIRDLEEMTFGELKERLEKDPGLADRVPAVKRLMKSLRDAMPKFQEIRFPVNQIAVALTRIRAPMPMFRELGPSADRGPVNDGPDSIREWLKTLPETGLLVRQAARLKEVEYQRHVAQLNVKVDELTALIRLHTGVPPIDIIVDPVDGRRRSKDQRPPAGESNASKRTPGRPTRKTEILQLFKTRGTAGLIAPKLAEEARGIRQALCDLYKGGLQAGDPPIPSVDTIENIIRAPYKTLKHRRNGPKRFGA